MKFLIFGVLALSVLFTSQGFAYQQPCSLSMGKTWEVSLSGSGDDYGVEGMHPYTYTRRPSKTVALNTANEALNSYSDFCAEVCTYNNGSFGMTAKTESCRYEANWPYFWECSAKATVSCN